ncbi:MAG: solute:sodium symporter family transporter [Planctomycetaceae bacterium]
MAILSFVFFTGLVGLLTYLITRGKGTETSDGYFLAGRSLTASVIAGSLLLTNLSTEQLVGLNGAAFADGICVMAWEVIAGISLVLLALFFLPRYLAKGITTIPEFLSGRFNESTRVLTNLIFVGAYTFLLLPIILYTGATGVIGILDLPETTDYSGAELLWGCVWLIGILGSIYAIFGGLRSVAVSDTLNGVGLLTGGAIMAYLSLAAVSNGGPIEGLSILTESHPEKFKSLGGPSSSVPWPTLLTGVLLLNMFYWTTNQQIIQRAFAAKTLAEGQKGVLLAACFKVGAPVMLVLPGIVAFHLDHQGELFSSQRLAMLAERVDQEYESMMQLSPAALGDVPAEQWKAERLLAFKKDQAYGALVSKVLPKALTGFFAAVIVGAILSSFNSVLNSIVTLISLNIYKPYVRPTATDREVVHMGRVVGTVIAIASMSIAPLLAGQDSIFGYLQKMNGLYAAPIFAVVLVGMFTRRVPAWAANLALIAGVAMIAVVYFVPQAEPIRTQIHDFHFLGLVFAILVAGMLIAGAVAPRSETAMNQVSAEETAVIPMEPWPLAVPAGVGIVVVVLAIYAWLAI